MQLRIVGSGSYIPELIIPNRDFSDHTFLDDRGNKLKLPENHNRKI